MTAHITDDLRLLYCPCPSQAEAIRLGRLLIANRLAACVNIIPEMLSILIWNGQTEETHEALLLAKTTGERLEAAKAFLLSEHPYDCTALLTFTAGSVPEFAKWVTASCTVDTYT